MKIFAKDRLIKHNASEFFLGDLGSSNIDDNIENDITDDEINEIDEDFDIDPDTVEDAIIKEGNNLHTLSPEKKEEVAKQIEQQTEFIKGQLKKVNISAKRNAALTAFEEAGVTIETVGNGLTSDIGGIECIFIKNLTQSIIDASQFECFKGFGYYSWESQSRETNLECINNGIRLGTMLGRKLQIRNEERNTQYTRLKFGKIDKRLIASLDYSERVFNQTVIDKYTPICLHISVDASRSMIGKKWNNTISAVVAICKAASMTQNLDVTVNFRTSINASNSTPLVIMAYDSRKDKFEKIRRLFPNIYSTGNTPEGLCFEAISKYIKEDNSKEQIFINFSDGEPWFEGKINGKNFTYEGYIAIKHTQKQVNNMRAKGIKILSYFITDSQQHKQTALLSFKEMYGNSAEEIDVTNLIQLAKSLNEMFLTK